MTRLPLPVSGPAALLLLTLAASPSPAAEADYLGRYEGTFVGSGTIQRDVDARPIRVNCTVRGEAGTASIDVSGTCRAFGIFTRRIGASLQANGRSYSGRYTGSTAGASALAGRRSGDTLNLGVTWPKPIYGDRKGSMTLTNSGGGGFTLRVSDVKDGRRITTTDITFRRR